MSCTQNRFIVTISFLAIFGSNWSTWEILNKNWTAPLSKILCSKIIFMFCVSGRSTIGNFYKDFQAAINEIFASNDDLEWTDWSLYQAAKMVIYLILSFLIAFLCHFSNQNRLQNLKLFRLRDFFRKFIRQLYEQLSRWCFRPTGDALRIDQKLKIRI